MSQLPTSMRRKPRTAAVTSIHDRPITVKDKLLNIGGWLLLVFATCIAILGVYGLYKLMTDARAVHLDVVGIESPVEKQQITTYVQSVVQNNYFTTDLGVIRDRTLELSWVDKVVVSRAWPDQIRIRVIPKHPIARWGTGRLLSDSGLVFKEAVPKNYTNLPLLHGPATQSKMMMRRYNEINQLFKPYGLHLKELYLTERMTWFMQFDTGLRIIADQDQTMTKLQRLSQLAAQDLNPVWGQITTVDLRYRNGLSIQWKGAPPVFHGQFVVTNNESAIAGNAPAKR